jgi:hypothetical protein
MASQLSTRPAEDVAVVALTDHRLREGIASLRWGLDRLLADGQSKLVIDLGGIDQVSATLVAAMLWAKRWCLARRVEVVVQDPSRRTHVMLRRTGLETALKVQSPPRSSAGRTANQTRSSHPPHEA